ncbi:MAG: chlororespiratory reduction protein 7 [Cyanobacteriota bacterium]|nr:chlororespiratory reduction protein 7 [Cyanobacteriota bacterium]
MSHPLLRQLEHYVVLEPGRPERILTVAETEQWLVDRLAAMESWPADLPPRADGSTAARRLLETACELEVAPGEIIQWFAVRID